LVSHRLDVAREVKNKKEENDYERDGSNVVRLNQLYLIVIFRIGAGLGLLLRRELREGI